MARNEAPKPSAHHQRNDQSRCDAHVLEILKMNGRHAAQEAKRHVEILSGNRRKARRQGRWRIVDVGKKPNAIAFIEPAGDLRDIGRGITIAEKSFEFRRLGLRENFAMACLVKAIHHDAIVSGELPNNASALVAKGLQRGCGDDRRNRGFKGLGDFRNRARMFDLNDKLAVRSAVDERGARLILYANAAAHRSRDRLYAGGQRSGRTLPECSPERSQSQPVQVAGDTKIDWRVVACLDNHLIGFANDQQSPMRLNRAREMDLLTLAVRKICGSKSWRHGLSDCQRPNLPYRPLHGPFNDSATCIFSASRASSDD